LDFPKPGKVLVMIKGFAGTEKVSWRGYRFVSDAGKMDQRA